ncbi:MAG: selenium-dependent molybdenum cofactor biosynthesis protein YqeB [Anaerolineales bacterium]|jgi:xanthine dehydrogenase accessory factor
MNGVGPRTLIRGGGDLATGVAYRLHQAGFAVVVAETEQPLAVRRLVALAEAIYAGSVEIEGLRGVRVFDEGEIQAALKAGEVPVIVDPEAGLLSSGHWIALIDGRMRKRPPELPLSSAPMVIGLGPGFTAGKDCHAVVETNRGHRMGRVYWEGSAEADTGVPEAVLGYDVDRVLRAPAEGVLMSHVALGKQVHRGETIATVDGHEVTAAFDGVLRGLIHDGLPVHEAMKIGDLDPRRNPSYCTQISDKSLAVGGGVLEAMLSSPKIRRQLAA